jgi:proline iminopeptidase
VTDLHVVEHGDGPAVAVLHGGLGLDHTYLRPAFDALGDEVKLVYPDHRGNGGSPRPDRWADLSLASWADDLDGVRASQGVERWVVIGHSYGSFIALTYALRHPARLAGLVIVGGGAAFQHVDTLAANVTARAGDRAPALLQVLGSPAESDAHLAREWPHLLPLYYHRWDARFVDAFAATRYSGAAYNQGAAQLPGYDLRGDVHRITAPTLVLTGDDDFIMPAAIAGEPLAAAIPDARFASIPAAGHFPFHESPVPFFAEVRRFLAALIA